VTRQAFPEAYVALREAKASQLADGTVGFIYNLLPIGTFYGPSGEWIWIDDEKARQIAANFGKYPGYEVPVKEGHGDGAKSPGRVTSVTVVEGEGVSIAFEVNAEAAKAINEGLYRYMSAEFVNDYADKATGKSVGAVLIGAALTNQPGHPGVVPFRLSDVRDPNPEGGEGVLTNEEIQAMQARVAELEGRVTSLSDENKGLATKLSESEEQLKRTAQEKRKVTVQAFSDKWKGQGVPPALVDKLAPMLEQNAEPVVCLSEGGNEKRLDLMEVLETVLSDFPKVKLGLGGDPEAKPPTAVEEQVNHGKRIAERANQ
jgi:hypothetical protein